MSDDYIKSVHRNIRQLGELSRYDPAEFAIALRKFACTVIQAGLISPATFKYTAFDSFNEETIYSKDYPDLKAFFNDVWKRIDAGNEVKIEQHLDEPEETKTGKMYSVDGEYYYLDLDTVMDDLRNQLKPGEETTIFEADAKSFTHNDFINIDYLFDDMQDRAFEEMGEFTDGYLAGVNQEIKTELTNLIAEFLNDKFGNPAFFEAVNEKEITVTVTP